MTRRPASVPPDRGRAFPSFRSPTRRTLALLLLAGFAVLLIAVVTIRLWAYAQLSAARSEAEGSFVTLDPSDYAMPPVDPGDDVVVRLQAVAEMIGSDDQGPLSSDLVSRPASQWSEEERRQVRSLLVAHAAALVRARSVVHLSSVGQVDASGWAGDSLDAWLPMSLGLRLLRLHAALAVHDGEGELAAGSIAALTHVADAFYSQPRLSLQIEGCIAEQWQLASLRELLATAVREEELLTASGLDVCRRGGLEDLRRALGFAAASTLRAGNRGLLGPDRGAVRRLGEALLGDLLRARSVRTDTLAAEVGRLPFPQLSRRLLELDRSGLESFGWLPSATAETEPTLFHLRAVAAGRHQARLALAAARSAAETGSYPETLPGVGEPIPFLLTASTYTRRPDGSAVVDHPVLRQLLSEQAPSQADLVLWPLAAREPAADSAE